MSFKITLKSEQEKVVVFSQGNEELTEHIKKIFKNIVSDVEFIVASASQIKAEIDVNSQGSNTYSISYLVEDGEVEKMNTITEIFKSNEEFQKAGTERMPDLADFKKLELLTGEIKFQ